MAAPAEVLGSSGGFVASVLEVAGSVVLSQMLNEWWEFFQAAGVLIFVVGCIVAFHGVVQGNWQRLHWVVLGPALLFAILGVTAPMNPQQVDSEEQLTASVKRMVGEYYPDREYRLPLLVVQYDRLVESVIGSLTGLLGDHLNKAAYLSAARDRVYGQILTARGEDQEYLELLALSLMGQCGEMLVLARDLSEPRLRFAPPGSSAAQEASNKLERLNYYRQKRQSLRPGILNYLSGAGVSATQNPNCEQIWQYSMAASLLIVERLLSIDGNLRQQYLHLSDDDWRQVAWGITDRLTVSTDDPLERVQALRMLAGFFLHNSLNSSTLSAFITQQHGRQDWMFPGQERLEESGGRILSTLRVTTARFASSVPYVEGIVTYLLLISFPFFALASLLPLRAGSIILWCGLWLWVKSWSVGYALVWLVRDLMWRLLPSAQTVLGTEDLQSLDWNDTANIFLFVVSPEPILQLNGYYAAISIMTMSVPLVSAYFFQGASQLMRVVSTGFANSDGLQRRRYRGESKREVAAQ